jgi:hypothetical protein
MFRSASKSSAAAWIPTTPHFHANEYQNTNIKAAIKLYEEREINGMEQVFIKDGKIVSREESFKWPSPSICEGRSYQLPSFKLS